MRPLRPFCGTVLKAQFLTLPATISTSANGVVTTQLSFRPPASSSATEVLGSSESRPATVLPPEPPPTTTKSNVSVTRVSPSLCFLLFIPGWPEGPDPARCRQEAPLLRGFWQGWFHHLVSCAKQRFRRHKKLKTARFGPFQSGLALIHTRRTRWRCPGCLLGKPLGRFGRRLRVGRFVSGPALEGA